VPTLALHKPFGVLSRFTADGSANRPLSTLNLPKGVWPIGRLDADSEGLLVLSSDKALVDQLLSPRRQHEKTYLAQVERVPDDASIAMLTDGSIVLDGKRTLRARARVVSPPASEPFGPRDPPVRLRKSVSTAWIELVLVEGRNRQVRRMTAAAGHPTLRLVRSAIGAFVLGDLAPGTWRTLDEDDMARLLIAPRYPTMTT
jgi:23S rRNA pseudouridine2457 synthase